MRIEHYDWSGGTEAMLRFGPDTGPVVIAALPLFEEANRTRAFTVSILRALAERGIASILPDLPGTGESLFPPETLSMLKIQEGFEGVAALVNREGRPAYGIGIRSGALLDHLGLLLGRWHFAPQEGKNLLGELTRIKQAELRSTKPLSEAWYFDGDKSVEIAGNFISPDLLVDLKLRSRFDEPGILCRVVRLRTDPRPADAKLDGAPLWRRSEPSNDLPMVQTLATDIANWIATCEG